MRRCLAAVLLVMAVSAAPAGATFSGLPGRIAYVWESSIWTIRADGSDPRQVVADGEGVEWSPDGRWIAYNNSPRGAGMNVWVARADGSRPRMLAAGAEAPAWSPSGRRLALGDFTGTGGIDIIEADGSGRRPLTVPPAGRLGDSNPSWSPDGKRIAFERTEYGAACHQDVCGTWPARRDVYVVNADGTGERIVATDAADPDWRPDGKRLLVTRRTLATVRPDGSGMRDLGWSGMSVSWSPTGRRLVSTDYYTARLLTSRVNGVDTRRVGRIQGVDAAWQPLPRRRR